MDLIKLNPSCLNLSKLYQQTTQNFLLMEDLHFMINFIGIY